jgi:cold shock protein
MTSGKKPAARAKRLQTIPQAEPNTKRSMSMPTGKIKKYVEEKGFGFIEPDEGGADVFFHISVWQNAGIIPAKSDRVTFEKDESRDGRERANSVRMS